MTKAIEILEINEVNKEMIFTTEGNIHLTELDLLELANHGTNFVLTEELGEEYEMIQLDYAEVFTSLDGGNEVDVYIHTVEISYDDETNLSNGGRLVKTYKSEATAVKYAERLGIVKVTVN